MPWNLCCGTYRMYVMEEFPTLLQPQSLHFQKLRTVHPSPAWCTSARFALRNNCFYYIILKINVISLCKLTGFILQPLKLKNKFSVPFFHDNKTHAISTKCYLHLKDWQKEVSGSCRLMLWLDRFLCLAWTHRFQNEASCTCLPGAAYRIGVRTAASRGSLSLIPASSFFLWSSCLYHL